MLRIFSYSLPSYLIRFARVFVIFVSILFYIFHYTNPTINYVVLFIKFDMPRMVHMHLHVCKNISSFIRELVTFYNIITLRITKRTIQATQTFDSCLPANVDGDFNGIMSRVLPLRFRAVFFPNMRVV